MAESTVLRHTVKLQATKLLWSFFILSKKIHYIILNNRRIIDIF